MRIFFLTLSCLVFILACGSEKVNEESHQTPSVFSPNEDSELALLMRFMYDDMYRLRAEIKAGKHPKITFPAKELFTAEPTDENQVSSDHYHLLGKAFLAAVNQFQESDYSQLSEHYEVLVESCMSCHQYSCPGPMRRIRNLYL